MEPTRKPGKSSGSRKARAAAQKKAMRERPASEIMSKVVYTLGSSATIRQALDKMNRYRVNELPLVSRGRVIGAVSRQTVDGAISHGLGKARVKEIASSEVSVVPPETSLVEVRKVLLQSNLGFVLVGRNRKEFEGIVSRMLLFEHLPDAALGADRRRIRLEGMIEKKLSGRILAILHAVRQLAETLDVRPYLVGGLVRDLLLGRENTDVDLVVEGDGIQFAGELQKALGGNLRTHQKFGTAILVLPDGFKVDLASSRTEFYSKPGALPTVQRGDIHHDLYRRDFTINALAIALHPKQYGRLVDRFGGHRDLENRTIRVLHSLSFIEDPTRAYRAVRFANRLGFELSPETATYLRVGVRKKVFRHLSGDRLLREVIFILMENRPLGSLKILSQFGLLGVIHPALKLTGGRLGLLNRIEQVLDWYDALPYRLEPLLRWQVYFLGLLEGFEKRQMEALLNRLSIRGRSRKFFLSARSQYRSLAVALKDPKLDSAATYAACSSIRPEFLLYASAKSGSREIRRNIGRYLTELSRTRLEITGRDLQELGLTPGPAYSRILREVLRTKLRGEISGRTEEMAYARTLAGQRKFGG